MFENIPHEMRMYPQWVAWRYEDIESKKPTKVPYCVATGRLAKVNDPSTWSSFDNVVFAVTNTNFYSGIGFVLTDNDPYSFIDLDDTDGDQIALDRQIKIFNEFESYAERSPSGKGLHIIVKGSLPSGRRRAFIEIYSSMRYMTMTGDVYRNAPIKDCNDLLNVLHAQMSEGKKAEQFYEGMEKAKYSDEEILKIANSAANSEKFNDLFYFGNWQKYYPSQSEADFALVDILAFYSENRFQVQSLFLQSALGQREKSRAQYRITYMLDRCFDRMLPPVDIDGLRNKLNEAVENKMREVVEVNEPPKRREGEREEPAVIIPKVENNVFTIPPGLVGEIAQFMYAQAPRPVPEIALAGALGFVAGIVGRAYNISGTGLNQYILLLAPTGTGKEAIAGGIDKLMAAVTRAVPAATDFIGPAKINSEQALLKYLNRSSVSFSSLIGEMGIRMREMSSPNAAPHMANLLALYLDLFNKSGEGKIMRPSIYSDKDKNTGDVIAPAVSLIGESSPEKFYEILDESMISSGLLPRFNIVEYHGNRPPLNENHLNVKPSFEVIEKLSTLCAHALMLNSQHKAIHVKQTQDAAKIFKDFDKHCDDNINSSEREIRRHLWNRAHINALKLAALISVGCNPYEPTVDSDIASWAINIIVSNVRNMLKRFDAGEIGINNDETKQLTKVIATITDFILHPWSDVVKYAGEGLSKLHGDKIVPYAYLQRRLASVAVFRQDKMGSSFAIKRAIKTLCERGDIQEVGKALLAKDYETNCLAYAISNLKIFGL